MDRSEILLPGVSFLRGREDREEHSGQNTVPRMLSVDGSLPPLFKIYYYVLLFLTHVTSEEHNCIN